MSDFVTLTCPNCGGKLDIAKNYERFTCNYCGVVHLVKFGGGQYSLAPVMEEVKAIKTGVDIVASELAIKRLEQEILDLNKAIQKIEQQANIETNPLYILALIGGILMSIFSLLLLLDSQNLVLLFVLIFGFSIGLMGFYAVRKQSKEITGRRMSSKAKLEILLGARKIRVDELSRHKEIIKMGK